MRTFPSNVDRPPAGLAPVLHDGIYVFLSLDPGVNLAALAPVITVHEREGVTVVVKEEVAITHKLDVVFRAAWITLNLPSDLHMIGLTATFATALGRAGISCNVVAGVHHDHIFVPATLAQEAMAVLRELVFADVS